MKLMTIKINIIVLLLFVLTDVSCDGVFRDIKNVFQTQGNLNEAKQIGTFYKTLESVKKGKHNEFQQIENNWPNYFLFEPHLNFGINF